MTQTIGLGGTISLDAIYQDGTGTAYDPADPRVDIIDSNGTILVTDAVPTQSSAGHYFYNYAVPGAGPLGVWAARWSGTINGTPVQMEDLFTAVAAGSIEFPSPSSSGICSAWTTVEDAQGCASCSTVDEEVLDDMIVVASDVLFALSEYRFSGICGATVRPCGGKPGNDGPIRFGDFSMALSGSTPGCGCSGGRSCGCTRLSEITLGGWPVVEVTEVKVDGAVLDSSRYRVDDHRYLVRLPNADGSLPSWPCCQSLELDSTEDDTFEVSFTYGQAPPASGVLAANVLACQLALACAGDSACRLPSRVTSIVRQGVSMTILDPFSFLEDGLTGLYEVDLFLGAYSGKGRSARMPAAIINPDWHRAIRRTGT